MSKVTGDNSKVANVAIIKYISCNDFSFSNKFKIKICSKCDNWCNDKVSPPYLNKRQNQCRKRNHICEKYKESMDNNGNIISIDGIKESFL